MVSFKGLWPKIVDLIIKRVIFLFIVGIVLSFVFIDQYTLKVKTLNVTLPSPSDLKEFSYHPTQMNKLKIRDILTYYKFVCEYTVLDAYDNQAAEGIVAYAYYYLGDEKKAISYLSQAEKRYEHFFWINYNLGVIYYNEEHYNQAMDYFALAKDAYPYTIGFLLATRTYKYIAKSLNLKQDDFQQNLDQGGERIKRLYMFSKMMAENPDYQKQFERKKIDLRLF